LKKEYFIVPGVKRQLTDKRDLSVLVSEFLGISVGEIEDCIPLRESIDARKKNTIHWLVNVAVKLKDHSIPSGRQVHEVEAIEWNSGSRSIKCRPVIIGAGPAGLFAAYGLVKKGYRPIIIEQGKRVSERDADVGRLKSEGVIDPKSNFVFGEGGAGTYSDGKLTARNRSPITDEVYRTLVEFGADKAVIWQSKPHVGTDKLRVIVPALTDFIIKSGAEVLWNVSLNSISTENNGIVRIVLSNKESIITDVCLLATGHSSDSVYHLLRCASVPMEVKTFAIGVRIEHPREFMDAYQYGDPSLSSILGAASYRLSAWAEEGRGVYSFCVCPGGEVMNASSDYNRVTVNGMSNNARNGKFTNGAIVVSILPKDLPSDPIKSLEYREQIEKLCYKEKMLAPAQNAKDYMRGIISKSVKSSYRPGIYQAEIGKLLPHNIGSGIKVGLSVFERKIRGFIDNGVLVAPETGTSSPVRILRNGDTMESTGMSGLYPIGEGAGYAGGIISSAADGLKAALLFKTVLS
jgi:uncharacterized FAD-dependent dehydrogenase